MGFETFLQLIKTGDPVSPGSVNSPLAQVQRNAAYLKELIEAAALGSTIYAREVTVEADAQVGMPVYYNSQSQRFERALAQTDVANGILVTAASADVWGIVATKHNSTLADLLLYGYAELDISAAVSGTVAAGTYYLSGSALGYLTQQRPSVTVPVLKSDGNGNVLVNPRFVDFLDSHRHYRFELTCLPAGTAVLADGRWTITDADSTQTGWLPADDASFNGHAPVGAVFGYNIAAEAALQAAWPPLPASHVYLEWDRGTSADIGFQGVPLGTTGQCRIDRYGIWWLSDCETDVPWPSDWATVSESTSVSAGYVECPRNTEMGLILWFTKLNFFTDATVVTSLASLDERLKIYCAGTTTEGSVGDLEIDLDLDLTLGVDTSTGYLAVKTLNGDKLDRGPIASGVYATTANVILTSEFQTTDGDGNTVYHGAIALGVLSAATQELGATLVRLDGATEETVPVLYVGLPADRETSFIVMFEVPADAPTEGLALAYRARILGRTAGTLPLLTVEYMVVARPTAGLVTPITVTEDYNPVTIDTVAVLDASNEAVEATATAFSVVPGDLVYIRVTRTPGAEYGDEYAGEIGLLQQVGVLTNTAGS